MTVSEICTKRTNALAAVRDKYWKLRVNLMRECQAEIDAIEKQYRNEMNLNLHRINAREAA